MLGGLGNRDLYPPPSSCSARILGDARALPSAHLQQPSSCCHHPALSMDRNPGAQGPRLSHQGQTQRCGGDFCRQVASQLQGQTHLCQLPGCHTWTSTLELSLQTCAFPPGMGFSHGPATGKVLLNFNQWGWDFSPKRSGPRPEGFGGIPGDHPHFQSSRPLQGGLPPPSTNVYSSWQIRTQGKCK